MLRLTKSLAVCIFLFNLSSCASVSPKIEGREHQISDLLLEIGGLPNVEDLLSVLSEFQEANRRCEFSGDLKQRLTLGNLGEGLDVSPTWCLGAIEYERVDQFDPKYPGTITLVLRELESVDTGKAETSSTFYQLAVFSKGRWFLYWPRQIIPL